MARWARRRVAGVRVVAIGQGAWFREEDHEHVVVVIARPQRDTVELLRQRNGEPFEIFEVLLVTLLVEDIC